MVSTRTSLSTEEYGDSQASESSDLFSNARRCRASSYEHTKLSLSGAPVRIGFNRSPAPTSQLICIARERDDVGGAVANGRYRSGEFSRGNLHDEWCGGDITDTRK